MYCISQIEKLTNTFLEGTIDLGVRLMRPNYVSDRNTGE